MSATDAIVARPVTPTNFVPYGKVYNLMDGADPAVGWTIGNGWDDGFTRTPLIEGAARLGLTRGGSAPWFCTAMERHPETEEAIFCAAGPVILAVAPVSEAGAPHGDAIEAFIIAPGQAVVMHRNVWHDACRGLSGPASYYWMAICGLKEDPWVPIEGGPRRVQTIEGTAT